MTDDTRSDDGASSTSTEQMTVPSECWLPEMKNAVYKVQNLDKLILATRIYNWYWRVRSTYSVQPLWYMLSFAGRLVLSLATRSTPYMTTCCSPFLSHEPTSSEDCDRHVRQHVLWSSSQCFWTWIWIASLKIVSLRPYVTCASAA